MIDERFVSTELETAAHAAKRAHALLAAMPEQSADYQRVLNAYLQSVIRYMSIVNVVQARQHELLTEEVAELRAKVDLVLADSDDKSDRMVH
ncbi:hypothetical protein [Reyranella sp.]|uniref:hypothetical protein n=1 Tax=Reyranella sp. TaxID=1929291 RepID=UPI00273157AA|nr:hypothetical protein [Reyranella sp.]MDP2372548.1 hypothetical protein [Reyranella sp.]